MGPDSSRANFVSSSFTNQFQGMSVVSPQNLSLLGVSLFEEGIDNELNARLMALKHTCPRLEQLDHHDALFLLKNMFFI